ncbi:MAG TPA: hypothetical protein VNI52_11045 [Sphingobacteriaceae bacterium]|nr:hypothetical protein [Sphingobacteriaceae bacterium]
MKLIWSIFIICSFSASGQVNPGARLTALGSSGVALQDYWSSQSNEAGLTEVNTIVAAINFQQQVIDQDISTQSALIIYPALKYVFALTFSRYGFSAYNEQLVSLAASRRWGQISLGLGFNYHQLKIQNYGSSDAVSVDIGFQYKLNKDITLGAHVTNPARSGYNNEVGASVPVSIDFGGTYRVSNSVLLTSEIQKTLNSTTSLKFGTEYKIIEWLALRGGISSNPVRQYFGFGISHQKFRFDAATYSQSYLGFVPQIGLSYEF